MYFTLMYFTLCTMHLTRCTSLDVLHPDLLHSVYYALHSVYYALDTLHFNRCINAVYLILCTFSEGRCTEEPFAMLSGKKGSRQTSTQTHALGGQARPGQGYVRNRPQRGRPY